jgi:hypothetical protein
MQVVVDDYSLRPMLSLIRWWFRELIGIRFRHP